MQRGCYGVRSVPRLQSETSSMLYFNNESISYIQDIVNICCNVRAPSETIILLLLVAGRVFVCHHWSHCIQRATSQLDR